MSDIPNDVDPGELEPENPELEPEDLELEPENPELEPENPELEPEDPEPQAARQTGGRKTQAQRWRDRAERTETQLQTLQREIAEIRARPIAAPDPMAAARAEAEERERVSMMGPAEAAEYYYRKGQAEFSRVLQSQAAQTQDLIDKQAYDAAARNSRIHQQYQQRVEDLVRSERARGNTAATREAVLAYLVGQDAIKRATSAAPGQRRAATTRVAGQRTQPSGARGDGARQSRAPADSLDAVRERIRNQPLW